jgi:hypothetical protein
MSLVEELQGHFIGPFLNMTIPEMDSETMLHVMILLLPFIFYTIAWHWPSIWCVFAENLGFRPSILFAYVAYIMKLLQFSVFLGPVGGGGVPSFVAMPLNLILNIFGLGIRSYELQLNPLTILDILLVSCGQALNSGVYKALGTVGVYYGSRFGENIPWVNSFPYNIGISDPQYWGCILTTVGSINLLQLRNNAFYVTVVLVAYVSMMLIESKERTPPYVQKSKKK